MDREKIKIDLIIHDFKSPLAVVESGITLLLNNPEKYGPITAQQEKVLNRSLRNTRMIKMLVNDALELGKSREKIVNLTNFRLSELFEETLIELFDLFDSNTSERIKTCTKLSEFKEAMNKNRLFLFIDEDLWHQEILFDKAKIKQILRNLLNNALKYRKSFVELKTDIKDDHLFFSVKDDGEGIPSVFHKKIFEKYFQLDANDECPVRGYGLGLAGVSVLVEDLDGRFFLDSEKGEGAKFSVKLPLVRNPG
jgi:signal transduction histidine kinase